jgi:LAS superfamily LD-carboxypeptidase LdcB
LPRVTMVFHLGDIYTAKSSSCDTPTARPGYSNHQGGRAVDLVIDKGSGVLIKRGTPQDKWLKENAEKYGLTNLPSEAWHYSTNGN